MIRLLSISTTSEIGGADLIQFRTLSSLDRRRFSPEVLLPHDGPLVDMYRQADIPVHLVPLRKLSKRLGAWHAARIFLDFLPTALVIKTLCSQRDIDVVHSNTLHCPYGWLPARLLGIPHIWHVREIVDRTAWIGRLEGTLATTTADRVICMSRAIREALFDPDLPRVRVLYDGVDTDRFTPDGGDLREQLGISRDASVIGIASRLDPWKGILEFLDAAPQLIKDIPSAHILVAGGEIEGHAGYARKIRGRCDREDLKDRVTLTGWSFTGDRMAEVFRTMDVFVNTSTSPEPFGMSIVEAMSCGVPTVSHARGGPVEIIDEACGRLAPLGTADSLVESVSDCLAASPDRKDCRQRALQHFDLRERTRDFERVLEEFLRDR